MGDFAMVIGRLLSTAILVLLGFLLAGCESAPVAGAGELKAFRGNIEEPWRLSVFQEIAGSTNTINTTSDSRVVSDVERIRIFVRPAIVESQVERGTSIYDAKSAADELTKQVAGSAARWGRFVTVESESDAQLAVQARMSMLAIEGDTFKSDEEIADRYKGWFGTTLSLSRATDLARDIMRTQITLNFTDLGSSPPTGIHSSQITAYYAKKHGSLLVSGAIDQATGKRNMEFDGGLLQPELLPLLLGKAVDAAFIDSFVALDERLWKPADQKGGMRVTVFDSEE